MQDASRDVLGKHVDAQGRPLPIVLLELIRLDAVRGGTLLAPRRTIQGEIRPEQPVTELALGARASR